jgi:hypothetical protein
MGLRHRLEDRMRQPDFGTATTFGRSYPHEFEDDPSLSDAAEVAALVLELGGVDWRFARLDLSAACAEEGDDAFLYAYRAVQNYVRALSPTGVDTDWPVLCVALSETSAEFQASFRPLWEARDEIAHGNRSAGALVTARAERLRLLQLARSIVQRAIGEHERVARPRGPRGGASGQCGCDAYRAHRCCSSATATLR